MSNEEQATLTIEGNGQQGASSLTFNFDPPVLSTTPLGREVIKMLKDAMRKTYNRQDLIDADNT